MDIPKHVSSVSQVASWDQLDGLGIFHLITELHIQQIKLHNDT